jgi:hypothetical protein
MGNGEKKERKNKALPPYCLEAMKPSKPTGVSFGLAGF